MSWIQFGVFTVLLLGIAYLLLSIEAKLEQVVDRIVWVERELKDIQLSMPKEPVRVMSDLPDAS